MSKQPHPLAGFGEVDADVSQARDEALHEEAVVKALLVACKQPSNAKYDILQWVKENTNRQHLTLIGWHKVMGFDYDVFIQSAVVRNVLGDCTLDKLLRKFETRRMAKCYFEKLENRPDEYEGCAFALVVKCPWVRIGIVMHSMPVSAFRGVHFTIGTKEHGHITIETFDQFLRTQLHLR